MSSSGNVILDIVHTVFVLAVGLLLLVKNSYFKFNVYEIRILFGALAVIKWSSFYLYNFWTCVWLIVAKGKAKHTVRVRLT